ncbi:MAG: chlorite dismutase family protein [Candidatus Omnitrophica bacterium]|nr:chlorite dismutase family protein [Candidatus Omnitrophota bacterium]
MTTVTGKQETGVKKAIKEAVQKTLYVDFLFFKLVPLFRQQSKREKEEAARAFERFLKESERLIRIRPYLTLGLRQEVDFLLWVITEDLEKVQEFVGNLYRTPFGKYVSLAYSFVAMKKPSPYALPHQQAFEKDDPPKRFIFVYPFVKSREWYLLPFEKRQAIMNEHLRVAHEYPTVRLNTTYSFGLGDQEFMLAFEADDPSDFENLVQRLRETEGSRYVVRDTPLMIGTSQTIETLLKGLGL